MAADGPRAAPSPALPFQLSRLAGSLQGLPDPGGRAPVERGARHRAEPVARRICRACRGLGVVESSILPRSRVGFVPRPGSDASRSGLVGTRPRAPVGIGTGTSEAERRPGYALRDRDLESRDGGPLGPRSEPSSAWTTSEGEQKVERPLSLQFAENPGTSDVAAPMMILGRCTRRLIDISLRKVSPDPRRGAPWGTAIRRAEYAWRHAGRLSWLREIMALPVVCDDQCHPARRANLLSVA